MQVQARENVTVRWDVGLNRKKLAFFTIPRDEVQLRLAPGEQHSKHHPDPGISSTWQVFQLDHANRPICCSTSVLKNNRGRLPVQGLLRPVEPSASGSQAPWMPA